MRNVTSIVVPKGFVKVRYYGFFGPGRRRQLAALRQRLVSDRMETFIVNEKPEAGEEDEAHSSSPSPDSTMRCPICGKAMQRRHIIRPKGRSPP